MMIKFTRAWYGYRIGDIAVLPSNLAERLINRNVAISLVIKTGPAEVH